MSRRLAISSALVAAGLALWLARRAQEAAPRPDVRGRPAEDARAWGPRDLGVEQRERIRALEEIGYVDGSALPSALRGVTFHDRERAQPGLNFYTSGHGPEAILCDMDGNELHRWRYDFRDIWPDRPIPARRDYWRRAHLFENGDVIAIYEGWGIIRIDARSNLVWANPVRAHHDLHPTDGGEVYVLTRRAHVVPRMNPEKPILEDFVSVLDADGVEVARYSLLEALERSQFDRFLADPKRREGDIFHTNSLQLLDGRVADRAPWMRAGTLLVSISRLNAVAVVELERLTIADLWGGDFVAQHDPRILANGNVLLLDNMSGGDASSVLELDLLSHDVVWSYRGGEDGAFFTSCCGAVQRLPNGNTLISETTAGRAFEVTPDKRVVWEFHNPHRAGEQGEYVASLMEMVRLPLDFPTPYLSESR